MKGAEPLRGSLGDQDKKSIGYTVSASSLSNAIITDRVTESESYIIILCTRVPGRYFVHSSAILIIRIVFDRHRIIFPH